MPEVYIFTGMVPKNTKAHPTTCTEVSVGVRGIPAYKAGLRPDGAEKEQLEGC